MLIEDEPIIELKAVEKIREIDLLVSFVVFSSICVIYRDSSATKGTRKVVNYGATQAERTINKLREDASKRIMTRYTIFQFNLSQKPIDLRLSETLDINPCLGDAYSLISRCSHALA